MSTCPLSETQVEIVQRLAAGEPRKVLADDLGVSVQTIAQRLRSARDRTHANTDEHLVAIAVKRRWVK